MDHLQAGLTIRPTPYDDPDAVALTARAQEFYVERYGTPDETPVDPAEFLPPLGLFLVARLGGVPVASGGWRRSAVQALDGASAAELKRMFVVPERRGAGLARTLLAELERTALAAGHDVLVLESGTLQPEAIALYRSSGYQQIPGFGHYRDSPLSICFGKRLV